jgi:hypothetical protein
MTKRTQGKWKVDKTVKHKITILGPNIEIPCDHSTDDDRDAEIKQGEGYLAQLGNAQFICLAVNSHDALVHVLGQIINDLPSNKDWLDPAIEAEANSLLKTIKESK